MDQPRHLHLNSVSVKTVDHGLFFQSSSSLHLKSFCDLDLYALSWHTMISQGYCIFVEDSLISWKSKKQVIISRSSAEAKHHSMASTSCEMTWLLSLLADMHINHPALSFCDNQATLHSAQNPIYHEETMHMEIDYHLIREKIQREILKTLHLTTRNQLGTFSLNQWVLFIS